MHTTVHTSYWHQTAEMPRYAALDGNLTTDVAIIGGGITGLTAARWLKEAGLRVAVLEAAEIGAGTTGLTTGHLDATTDEPLARMIANFGQERARQVIAGSKEAIGQIERWCQEWSDCEFERLPSFQFTESPEGLNGLRDQFTAARRLGLRATMVQHVPLPFPTSGAVRVENQGRLHSLRYLAHLASEIHGHGSAIFENTSAQPPQDGAPCKIETSGGEIRARNVLVATHSPFLGISSLDFRVYPYQSYVIGLRVEDHLPDFLFWDDADPYHYLRLASPRDPDLVLVGGADHKTGEADDERSCYHELEQYAQQRLNVRSVEWKWSAQHYTSADGLPLVGLAPRCDHLYVASGFAGTGLTLGTMAGKLVADLILRRDNPLAEILNPSRLTPMASAKELVVENLDVMRRFVADRFGGEADSAEQVPPGKGAIVAAEGKQVAVYCDPSGRRFTFSPVCTHAGCIVHWNEAGRTWDCPCHGGRYTAEGQRFAGPPPHDLRPAHAPNKPR